MARSLPRRQLSPAEKAVLRWPLIEPLIVTMQRRRDLQQVLAQTSFWPELAPVLAVAAAVRRLKAGSPELADMTRSCIAAGSRRNRPVSLHQAISLALRLRQANGKSRDDFTARLVSDDTDGDADRDQL